MLKWLVAMLAINRPLLLMSIECSESLVTVFLVPKHAMCCVTSVTAETASQLPLSYSDLWLI